MNALDKANEIVYKRNDDHRQYGDHMTTMVQTAKVLSLMTEKDWSAEDVYMFYIVTKLLREQQHHKEDNIVDAVGYLSMLNDYEEGMRK